MLGFNLRLGHPARQAPAMSVSALAAALFRNGEVGFAYDTNDFSTLFQDAAGTTPVTAADQPVGLQLDKSKGLVPGVEQVTNGDFTGGATGWTLGTGWSVSAGQLHHVSSAFDYVSFGVAASFPTGTRFIVTLSVTTVSGVLSLYVRESTANATISTSGNITFCLVAGVHTTGLRLGAGAWVGSIDNISVRELPGNHRFQSAPAARPMLRYNATTGSYYLQYDGADDFLQTNAIDFTGTDKVSVFAGVRKLLGVANSLIELSASADTNAGSFRVGGFTTNEAIIFSARGATTTRYVEFVNGGSPISYVQSADADLFTSTLRSRKDGGGYVTSVAATGGGAFGNYAMYFGRRGGTTLPFNGHEYSPICVGRLTTAAEIANIERILARQVGVVLP